MIRCHLVMTDVPMVAADSNYMRNSITVSGHADSSTVCQDFNPPEALSLPLYSLVNEALIVQMKPTAMWYLIVRAMVSRGAGCRDNAHAFISIRHY